MAPLLVATLLRRLVPEPRRPAERPQAAARRPGPGDGARRPEDEIGDPAHGLVSALTLSSLLWLIVLGLLL